MWLIKNKIDDEYILKALQEDEASSRIFSVLYKRVYPKVQAYIRKSGGNDDESRDIFQDALLIFCKKVKEGAYTHQTEIDGYLYTISRNLWINRVKILNRKSDLALEELEIAGEDDVLQFLQTKEQSETFSGLLAKLGERCQELLMHSAFLKYSMKEIAEKLGFATENAAKTKNYKCKQRLLELVENNPELKQLYKP